MPGTTAEHHAGCSKRPFSKAAGESKPEAYPRGYVEDFDEPRTKLEDFFSILLAKVFHEHSGQGKIDGNARDVIGGRHKRARRNGRIYLHSLQQDGHECRHTG